MQIGVNDLHQIKQVREITDTTLTVIELDEAAELYPFRDWSDTKISFYCYRDDGKSTSVYPYIDINLIEKIESDNTKILQAKADIDYLSAMTGVEL